MTRQEEPWASAPGSLAPARAGSVALAHAQRRRTGLRGWRASQLQWAVLDQKWDDNLECYVVRITAWPLDQPQAPRAEWAYHLDENARVLPGFPLAGDMPPWEKYSADTREGRGPSARGPAKRDLWLAMASLAVVGALALGSLGWLLFGSGLEEEPEAASAALAREQTPTPVAAVALTPTPFLRSMSATPAPPPTLVTEPAQFFPEVRSIVGRVIAAYVQENSFVLFQPKEERKFLVILGEDTEFIRLVFPFDINNPPADADFTPVRELITIDDLQVGDQVFLRSTHPVRTGENIIHPLEVEVLP